MDKKEMFLWLATAKLASEGDKEAMEALEVEERLRKENGQKSLFEERVENPQPRKKTEN